MLLWISSLSPDRRTALPRCQPAGNRAKTFPTGERSQGRSGLRCRECDGWSVSQKKMSNGCLTLVRGPRRTAAIPGAPNWSRASPGAGLAGDGRYSTRGRCQKPKWWSSSSAPTNSRLRNGSSLFYLHLYLHLYLLICILFFRLSEPPRAPCARRTPFRNNSISSAIAAPPIISTSDNLRSNAPVNWVELCCDDASPGNLVVRYSGGGLRFTLGLRSALCGLRSTLPLQLRQ